METNSAQLPPEMNEEVLARVKCTTDVLRLRTVCTAWDSLISSQAFAQLHRQTTSPEPWLVVIRNIRPPNQKLYLCDRSMSRWLVPPLPFQTQLDCDFSTCRSAGGLICCVARRRGPRRGSQSILVFNPLTGASKMLPVPAYPALSSMSSLDIAIWRGRSSMRFKIAISDTDIRHLRVFDSSIGSWKAGCMMPDMARGTNPRLQGFTYGSKETLCWYNLEQDRWLEAIRPSMDHSFSFSTCPTIFQDESGGVRLVGILTRNGRRCASLQGFGIWKLDQHNNFVDRTPMGWGGDQSKERCEHSVTKVDCQLTQCFKQGNQILSSYRQNPSNQCCIQTIAKLECQQQKPPTIFNPNQHKCSKHSTFSCHSCHIQLYQSSIQKGMSSLSAEPLSHHDTFVVLHTPSIQFHNWTLISQTPSNILKAPYTTLRPLKDSSFICHNDYIWMSGIVNFSLSPWTCFDPKILVYNICNNIWEWVTHPLGDKTWTLFRIVCVLDPNLQDVV